MSSTTPQEATESKAQPTPGPWQAEVVSAGSCVGETHYVHQVVKDGHAYIVDCSVVKTGDVTTTPIGNGRVRKELVNPTGLGMPDPSPDARLIAAAPDLLKALKAFVTEMHTNPVYEESATNELLAAYEQARAAIAATKPQS